jgi:hypothetical protein
MLTITTNSSNNNIYVPYVQYATKNNTFIDSVLHSVVTNRTHITYWCSPPYASNNGIPNQDLIGLSVALTDMYTKRVIATGIIEDVIIEKVEDVYNHPVYGGNWMLGLKPSYNIYDFLWEINSTLSGKTPYTKSSQLGGIYIRLTSLPVAKHQVKAGNKLGIKNIPYKA